jgi:translation initiation factor 2 gamma subunit (eIF-2gamma)
MSDNNLENKIIKMESKLDVVLDKLVENKEEHAEIKQMVKDGMAQKANIWVETAITRLNWLVIVAVAGGLITLVIK